MRRWLGALAAALATLSLAACGSGASSTSAGNSASRTANAREPARSGAALRDLGSIDQLRVLFNAQSQTPRLIVLASPT